MKSTAQNKMEVKPMFPLLMTMAFPPMISMMVQSLYNIIDSMYVARYSEAALTAVSLAFPIQNLVLAVAVGTGIGVNSYIARKLGENKREQANNAVTHGLILSLISALLFAVIGIFVMTPFFKMFTDSAEIISLSVEYTSIILLFCFGTILQINIEKILQATGKMVFPMLLQIVGAVVNIILDPILIFGLFGFEEMGIKGAAIATIIGQIVAMVCSFAVLIFCKNDVKIDLKKFKFSFKLVKKIYVVGVPSILMIALGSVLVMGLNGILIQFSTLAVSVFGIYFKLQTFVNMPVSGLTQGAMPIMGYNYGAKNRHRLLQCLRQSNLVSLGIMLVGTLLFWFFPTQLLAMFNPSAEMLEMGVVAMKILSLSFVASSFAIIYSTLFQAMGKGFYSLIVFLLRQLVITLPAAYLLSIPFGITGIWLSFPLSEIIASVVAAFLWGKVRKKDPIILSHAEQMKQCA